MSLFPPSLSRVMSCHNTPYRTKEHLIASTVLRSSYSTHSQLIYWSDLICLLQAVCVICCFINHWFTDTVEFMQRSKFSVDSWLAFIYNKYLLSINHSYPIFSSLFFSLLFSPVFTSMSVPSRPLPFLQLLILLHLPYHTLLHSIQEIILYFNPF